MERVTVSSKYQVVIPRSVRRQMKIRRGQKIAIFFYDGQIRFIPVRPMKEMRGFAKGMDTTIERDKDRV